jgi:hypothetical protein
MNSDQGTGAGRLNWLARSVQVEKIAHTIRPHRRYQTSRRIAFNCTIRTGYPLTITTAPRAHKQRRVGA